MFRIPLDDGNSLELLQEHNARELFELTDRNRDHLRDWLGWVDMTRSEADSRAYIKIVLEQLARGQGFSAGIRFGDTLVGMAGFHPIDWKNRSVALGYWLSRDSTGRGLATRAAKKLTAIAHSQFQLNRVEIRCAEGNLPSQKIPERLGFSYEGTLRCAEKIGSRFVDHRIYSSLRN